MPATRIMMFKAPVLLAAAWFVLTCEAIGVMPITGTFLDVAYDERMKYTNKVSSSLTCSEWADKVDSLRRLGVDTIIFQAVHDARWGSYYPSKLPFMTSWSGACTDVVEAVLNATSQRGMHTFLSCEYVHTEFDPVDNSSIMEGRLQIMAELVSNYALRYASTSFQGWYFSSEAYIAPYFPQEFFPYIDTLSKAAKRMTPTAQIFVSPYGTRYGVNDETFVNQLKELPVDIVAYQDEVGCVRDELPVIRSEAAFQNLAAAHKAANRSVIWANVESFTWERMPNNVTSPLIPAEFTRMMAQWAAVSRANVAKVISFTMQGMFEEAAAARPWGGPNATYNAEQYEMLLNKSSLTIRTLLHAIDGSVLHEGIGSLLTTSWSPIEGYGNASLTDGKCGPQMPYSSRWNAYFVEPALPLVITAQRSVPWNISSVALHVLKVPLVWFKDGNWYSPVSRNFSSEFPALVEYFATTGNSSVTCDLTCVRSQGSPIGSAQDIRLAQTAYDIRSALFPVELGHSMSPIRGNTVVAIVHVDQPSLIMTDELIINFSP